MKNLKSYSNLLYLALVVSLTACESFVSNIPEAKLPQAESVLVVTSVISPQLNYITVVVTESVPSFSQSVATGKKIQNATVKISDGTSEATVPYDSANKLYSLEQVKFPIVASKTYTLSVSDGKRSVSARCTVPVKAPVIASYEFDTLVFNEASYKDTAITLRMTWNDIPTDPNQYRVNAIVALEHSDFVKATSGEFIEKRFSNTFNFNWNWQQGKNDFQNDNYQDGALFTSPVGKVHLPQVREEQHAGKKVTVYPKSKVKSVIMEIFNVDLHYYKYHQSLETSNNADNPFAEPSPIYSNVKGGLGCFAAYNAGQLKLTNYK